MDTPATLSQFVEAADLLDMLKVKRSTLLDWISKGMPHIRLGLKLYFHDPSVAEWLLSLQRRREP